MLLGRETRTKACRVLLAPTVNLHRSPLAGRNFECFSEDPLLTGVLAAAYIRGVQSQGVITTVKHFIGNEAETDRCDEQLADRRAGAARAVSPAVRDRGHQGGTLGVMTSYNRVNGSYCTEQRWLLTDVLRGEWGFEGFVTTDWMAGADTVHPSTPVSTSRCPAATGRTARSSAQAVRDGRVPESDARRLLSRTHAVGVRAGGRLGRRTWCGAVDRPSRTTARSRRRASADAMVLLRNEPVDDGRGAARWWPTRVRSIAVIGPERRSRPDHGRRLGQPAPVPSHEPARRPAPTGSDRHDRHPVRSRVRHRQVGAAAHRWRDRRHPTATWLPARGVRQRRTGRANRVAVVEPRHQPVAVR